MFQPGHAGECKITNYGSLGTSGTKCEKLMRCVCWNGHGRMHKKPKCKYETSTAGGSSLATLDEFMAKLHDFPDDLELAPFLDEIAKDEQYAKTICQSCAVHVLYQRNPGVCMKPYKHQGICVGPKCKTFGCMSEPNHEGDCTIIAKVGPRCKKTFGCMVQPDHEGECNISASVGPRCKSFGCQCHVGHVGDCKISAIVGLRCKTKGCVFQSSHARDYTINANAGPKCKTHGCLKAIDHVGSVRWRVWSPGGSRRRVRPHSRHAWNQMREAHRIKLLEQA